MSVYAAPIRRVDSTYRGKPTHHYEDANGRRVPGVTTLIGDGFPKPALINWAGSATANYAVDHWDELSEMGPSERLKVLNGSRYAVRDAAAKRGTEVHALAERLIGGESVEPPEELAGHVEAYVRFLDDFEPEPVMVEAVVANYSVGYAGSLDLVARFPSLGQTLLCDVKTNRSGVYGETSFQLAAYRYAEVIVTADGEQPMPEVDGCAVIHVRADGYSLIPMEAGPQQFTEFRHIARVARAVGDSKSYVGAPLSAPVSEAS